MGNTTTLPGNTTQLMTALGTLSGNTTQLEQQVHGFDAGLVTARNDLEIPIDLAGKLQSLSNTLSTTSNLLEVISIIPDIGSEAKVLKNAVDALAGPVGSASSAASRFAGTIRPLRDAVAKLEVRVQQLDQGLGKSIQFEQQLVQVLGQAQACIGGLPAGGVRDGLLNQLDSASGTALPAVNEAASGVATVNGALSTLESDLNAAENRLQALSAISGAIDSVTSALSPILDPMRAVANALSHEITVSFGVPVPHSMCTKWGVIPYPCDWYAPSFTFSVEDILKGVSGVLGPVMGLLNKAASAFLDPLLSALHLNFTLPSIPGIGDLANDLQSLLGALGNLQGTIGTFFNDLQALETAVQNVAGAIAPVQAVLTRCQSGR